MIKLVAHAHVKGEGSLR